MLRHWIAVTAALLSAIGFATAATAQTSWTGVYGGVNAFGTRDDAKASGDLLITQISNLFVTGRGLVVVPGTTAPLDASDHHNRLSWGGQIGFQWQTGPIVLGLEGDYDGAHHAVTATESQQLPPTALTPATTIDTQRDVRIRRIWSIRARAGYAFGNTLAYATAGYANARINVFATDSFTNPGGPAAACAPAPCQANYGPEGPNVTTEGSPSKSQGGWRAGLGLDQRLSRHFSIGLEFLHSDFGHADIPFNSQVTSFGVLTRDSNGSAGTLGQVISASTRLHYSSDSLGVRFNFRF